ncbi:transporter substrate-binding domain-containing protein [Sporomusa aerivorans]|uniref:transporter substrate-binding domain-containing protein n=1 Tax=Sporomusa aerivorans TaxID=204936 RepID=UPI00352B56B3
MKRISTLTVWFLMGLVLLVSGCGGSQPAQPAVQTNDAGPEVKAIKDRGVLKVGVKVDVPKFGYKDPQTNKIDGYEVDLARAIAKKILGDPEKLELQAVTAKTRGALLDNGDIDLVVATFTITDERKKSYNFSEPYIVDHIGLLVKKSLGAESLKDLDGKKIGVAQSATAHKDLQAEADKLGIKVQFFEFSSHPEIKVALESGRIDAYGGDISILSGYVDDKTVILKDRYSPQRNGVAIKKSNTALTKIVVDTIDEMQKSGELDKLMQKWQITR